VLHPPGVFVHDYHITVGDDGVPTRYTMKFSTPGAPTPPDLDSLIVTYGRDSSTLLFVMRDSSFTRRIAMHEGFPLLGQSFVGVELALMRLRRMHVDSAMITLHPPSEPSRPVILAPAKFVGPDSAALGQARIHVARDGTILGIHSGSLELRRVDSFDMRALTDGFVNAFAPQVVAQAAAAASRVEITLSTAQLDPFVGEYTLATTTLTVSRDGDHLLLLLPSQPAIRLLAMSEKEFFVRKPDLVVAFEVDTAGHVVALTLGQGSSKQRLTKTK